MAASGVPAGFDIITGALYEKDKADYYYKLMGGK
jgi:simple sugar transport system substrate-binding protein